MTREQAKQKKRRRRVLLWLLAAFLVILLAVALFISWLWNLWPQESYTAQRFGITTLVSPHDANGNGVDDYADLVAMLPDWAALGLAPENRGRYAPTGI